MSSLYMCKYCNGRYASQGGLTRHVRICPEKPAPLPSPVINVTHYHNTYNDTNTTNVVNSSQQHVTYNDNRVINVTINHHNVLIDSFHKALKEELSKYITSFSTVDGVLASIKAVKSSADNCDKSHIQQCIGFLCGSSEISFEGDDIKQAEEIKSNFESQLVKIEGEIADSILSQMGECHKFVLKKQIDDAGGLFLIK
jgi:hypothetical protein